MTTHFIDYFWGEKNDGFEVLYNNMKNGTSDCQELAEFVKERSIIEDFNSKTLSRLAKHAGSGLAHGTFGPLWQMLKSSADKLSHLHDIMVERLQELVKHISHYCEDQQKVHKQVKYKQLGTVDVIQSFQHIAASVLKAKENCYKRYIEVQKLRESGASKELKKAETKHRKACDEYCSCVKRYNQLRREFEKKMALACQTFQQIEEEHLQQMKKFLIKYSQVLENCYILIGQANLEFKQQCNEIDVSSLLEHFVKKNGTGIEVPGPVEVEPFHLSSDHHFQMPDGASFRKANKSKIRNIKRFSIRTKKSGAVSMTDLYHTSSKDNEGSKDVSPSSSKPNHAFSVADLTSTSSTPTTLSRSSALARTALRASNFLFRSKRKRKKKKEMLENHEHTAQDKSVIGNGRLLSSIAQSAPVIDSEGYTIRPPEEPPEKDKNSFNSSSETESDEDDRRNKIHVEIKPLKSGTPICASIDELKATVSMISLASTSRSTPSHIHKQQRCNNLVVNESMKRSKSVSHPLSQENVETFTVFEESLSKTASKANAPYDRAQSCYGHIDMIDKQDKEEETDSTDRNSVNSFFSADDMLSIENSLDQEGSKTTGHVDLFGSSPEPNEQDFPSIYQPVEPKHSTPTAWGTSDDNFKTSYTCSLLEQPSFTIDVCNVIPISAVFVEKVNAYFKGSDHSRCRVKLCGKLKLEFSETTLLLLEKQSKLNLPVLRLYRTAKIIDIHPNRNCVTGVPQHLSGEQFSLKLDMTGILTVLRKPDQQKSCNDSNYMVDILQYNIKSSPGVRNAPLHMSVVWKCEMAKTELCVEYKYNPSALASLVSISDISISTSISGGVTKMISNPSALWKSDCQQITWHISDLSHHSEGGGMGLLQATFDLSWGPSTPSPLFANFFCQNTSLSGVELDLAANSLGYQLSQVDNRVESAEYICEAEQNISFV